MTNRWLKLLETHIEKGILGVAGLCMLYMLWAYLIRSPNQVKYGNTALGPRGLAEAIKRDADELERKMGNADMEVPRPEKFSEQLKKQHSAGIFAQRPQGGPALPRELPVAATLGREVKVPGLKDLEEPAGSIALVTPLKPTQPRLRTGRSLALREPLQIAGLTEPGAVKPPGDEVAQAEEVAWVSVGAYFDKKAQYNEMINAGYAPYRSKAYVVGVDVERQEVLSSGEYSEWKPVESGKAMPETDLPEPVFDDETNQLSNKDEIRQAFATIKAAQADLMQPPFYTVERGDFWEVPPLAGYEDDDEEEAEEEEQEQPLSVRTAPPLSGRTMRPPPTIGSGGRGRERRPVGGSGRGAPGVRGSGGPRGGGYNPSAGAAQSDAEQRREARRAIRADLTQAKKLLGQKEYAAARDTAQSIMGNQYASRGDIRKAKDLVRAAERWIEIENERAAGGGRTRARGTYGREGDMAELITHPETNVPAVWFHDDTVEAGKTYRYHMRVKLWNRYVGRVRPVRSPEGARKPVVVGEWSFPSEPITVTPSTYFFFSGSRPADNVASTDVWKWRKGRWMKERFDVAVGDVIGDIQNKKTGEYDEKGEEIKADIDFSTGAVVLDLRFNDTIEARWPGKDGVFTYRQRPSTVMVYLDPADGQVKEKVLIFDRSNPIAKRLKEEAW